MLIYRIFLYCFVLVTLLNINKKIFKDSYKTFRKKTWNNNQNKHLGSVTISTLKRETKHLKAKIAAK